MGLPGLTVQLASNGDDSTGGDGKGGAIAHKFIENCSTEATVCISGIDCEHHISHLLHTPLTAVGVVGLHQGLSC